MQHSHCNPSGTFSKRSWQTPDISVYQFCLTSVLYVAYVYISQLGRPVHECANRKGGTAVNSDLTKKVKASVAECNWLCRDAEIEKGLDGQKRQRLKYAAKLPGLTRALHVSL